MAAPAELPEQLARRVTSWKVLIVAAGALLAAGGGAVLAAQRYAPAAAFEKHVRDEAEARQKLENRTTSLEAVMGYIHEDIHGLREQEQENARAVGARVVPVEHR